ncbi:MAG: hypothetical protein AB7M12_09455 [Hyphomonadaceae bacterium]
MLDIEKLLSASVDDEVELPFCRQLFVSVITGLESYLSDAFMSTVLRDKALLQTFVETTPEFAERKFPLSEIFKQIVQVEQAAEAYLADVVWHNLYKIRPMYSAALGVRLPDIGDLMKAVVVRHDLVHRNGKTKNGFEHIVTRADVRNLMTLAESFVVAIDPQLPE